MSPDPIPLDRRAIARNLREMASLLAIAGGDKFKSRAYRRAADVLDRLDRDLDALIAAGRLTELPGIGRGLAAAIEHMHRTGQWPALDELRRTLPPGAAELARVPGLTLPRIAALHRALGITSVAELADACRAGRARQVPGIGPKLEARFLEAIQALETQPDPLIPLDRALALGEALAAQLRSAPGVSAADVAGDLRRATETVDRLVLVAASSDPARALGRARELVGAASDSGSEAEHCAAGLIGDVPVELRVATPERYATALLYATGAPAHVRQLEERAAALSLVLTPAGLARRSGGRPVPTPSEPDVYARLSLPFIPPELREGDGEVAAALAGELPGDLVGAEDLRGLVHCHTVYSDGAHTIEQMARAAEAMGARYLTITDHSPTAAYAGGVSVDRLKAQWDEIARVQERVSIRLLRGTESDILADGRLDYPDAILEQLDVIIASIHARHRMDRDRMTERLVRAMRHPCFKIWGHGLGRLVQSRPPIDCCVETVLDAAAESRAAIEINGDPRRLDLPPRWLRAARERGIPFVVSTDAHSVAELSNQRYGVAMARRGWVRRGEVLNTLDADAFAAAVAPARAA